MSFNLRFLRPLLIAALLLTSAVPALAQDPKGPPPRNIAESPIFKELNLSEAQKKQIQESQASFAAGFEAKAQALQTSRQKLDQAMDADQDESKLREAFKNFQTAHEEFSKAGFEQSLAIRKILTPAQRKQMREIRQKQADSGKAPSK